MPQIVRIYANLDVEEQAQFTIGVAVPTFDTENPL